MRDEDGVAYRQILEMSRHPEPDIKAVAVSGVPASGVARCTPTAIERWQIVPFEPEAACPTTATPHSRRSEAETPEAFLADRQSFWDGFTKFTLWTVIFIVLLLIGMAVFLL